MCKRSPYRRRYERPALSAAELLAAVFVCLAAGAAMAAPLLGALLSHPS